MIDQIRDDLGVHLELKVNCRSDERDDIQACVTFQFGVNKMPSHEEVNEAIRGCIQRFNDAAGVSDGRLSNMSDFGFADSPSLQWQWSAEEEGEKR